jgi:antirestriction protein ArdC
VALDKGYSDSRWLTFNDAQRLGGYINKGEKHTKIVFWKFLEVKEDSEDEVHETNNSVSKKIIPLLRFYRVFNVEQCSNLKLKEIHKPKQETVKGNINELAENILALPTVRNGGNKASYYTEQDFIRMPPKSAFKSIEHYYATGFHETIHYAGFLIMLS